MSVFAVTRKAGPGWVDGGIFDQPALHEHAAFMNALAEEGFVVLAGPLQRTEQQRACILLVVEAEDEAEIHRRLAPDPWARAEQLIVAGIEQWTLVVGKERLATLSGAAS